MIVLLATALPPATIAIGAGPLPPAPTALVRVDSGTSVTIWERTTAQNMYTFDVPTLTGPGATFDTIAFEHYTVTSDGVYLTIHCFRAAWGNGTSTGNNIAGVRLNGVPGYPLGLWASGIVSYVVGYGGIASSRFEALGSDLATITFMGDQDSELVLSFDGTATNSAPVITSFSATPANEGEAVAFLVDATDPNGDPLTYSFDFDGDGSWDVAGPSPTASWVFGDDYAGTAIVLVTDRQLNDTRATAVAVANVAPTISFDAVPQGDEGTGVEFIATVFDPGSDDLVLAWFGEGSGWAPPTWSPNDPARFPDPDPSVESNPRTVTDVQSVVVGDDGTFDAELQVQDDDGGVASLVLNFSIGNLPPSLAVSPPTVLRVDENVTVALAAEARDAGTDDLTFSWSWDLGPSESRTVFNDGLGPDPPESPDGTFPFTAADGSQHAYGDECTCSVRLVVRDDDNGYVGYLMTVEVQNVAPTIVGGIQFEHDGEGAPRVGTPIRFRATGTDPGSDDLTFLWSWDDGTEGWSSTAFNDGVGPDSFRSPDVRPIEADGEATHAFAAPGSYAIRLEIRDDDAGNVTAEVIVVVAALVVNEPVQVNLKPFLAAAFAASLAIVGLWSARRRPWKSRAGAAKAFALVSLPFVGAELATGVASGLLGVLTIPPVFGLGLAVDLATLIAGVVTSTAWALRKGPSGPLS